eukprot:g26151.t1
MSHDDAIPIGEGWARHNGELLVHPPSQVYFAQRGDQRGKYLLKSTDGGWSVCPAPHVGTDCPIEVRAAASSVLRPGVGAERKLDRSVVLADMPKTARLALKFPLGFLDSPASCYALFTGLRGNAAAAHWCASQFHQRLLKEVAKKIHGWWDSEAEMPEELFFRGSHVGSLVKVLRGLLENLDQDLTNGPHGLGGCDAVVAVLIGEDLAAAAVGHASATLLFQGADAVPLVPLLGQEEEDENSLASASPVAPVALSQLPLGHASDVGALVDSSGLRRAKSAWDASEADEEDVRRILRAPDAFSVLGMAEKGPEGPAEAKTAYKRLALRVHPDKVGRTCDPVDAKAAFARLDSASKVVEALAEQNAEVCRELHRILRCDPFTVKGASQLLQVEQEAEASQVRTAAYRAGEEVRVALCSGATAELPMKDLEEAANVFLWQPKVAAMQWATKALALRQDPSAASICLCIREREEDEEEDRPAKRQRGPKGPRSVRLRHLLLRCAEAGKPLPEDPMARRRKAQAQCRTPVEAETELAALLVDLLSADGNGDLEAYRNATFRRLCQERSECSSADSAGQLCGDLGWVSRGQSEPAFEQAAFSLRKGELSDVVTSSRGVHLIQRIA